MPRSGGGCGVPRTMRIENCIAPRRVQGALAASAGLLPGALPLLENGTVGY
jgi:hypothetical protein